MKKKFLPIVFYSLVVTIFRSRISHAMKETIESRKIKDLFRKAFTLKGTGSLWDNKPNYVESCSNEGDVVFYTQQISIKDAFSDVIYVAIKTRHKVMFNNFLGIYLCNGTTKPLPSNEQVFLQKCSFEYAVKSTTSARNVTIWTEETNIFKFYKNTSNSILLAVRGKSVCARVYDIKLYYYYCEERYLKNIKFPKTMSPAEGSKSVEANCSVNSSPSNQTGIQSGFCEHNGTWRIGTNMGCFCEKGFEQKSHKKICAPCPSNHYKASSLNETCKLCPKGSTNTVNRTSCKCMKDHYKYNHTADPTTAACFAPIAEKMPKPEFVIFKNKTVKVTWKPVKVEEEIKHSLRYDVECFRCEKMCNLTCINVTYEPRQHNLTTTFVRILNLQPEHRYKLRVYPKTAIYKFIDKSNWSYNDTEIIFSLQPAGRTTDSSGTQRSISLFSDYVVISGIASGIVFVIMIVLVLVFVVKRKSEYKRHLIIMNQNQVELPRIGQKLYVDPSIYDSPEDALNEFASELDPSVLVLEKLIGGGEFGDVYKGIMKSNDGKAMTVAVKTLKNDHTAKNEKDFLLEASAMGQFHHPNVIHLEGVITKSFPRMIVTEYMSNGSLDHFLRFNEDNLTDMQLIEMAEGVATGMAYLSAMSFIHRDLAARNVLVSDDLLCKIADFGLSRSLENGGDDGEYSVSGGKIPVRWTAPEVIAYRKFSSSSDVWSYGILLWEIMSFGDRPYWEWDNYKVMTEVEEGFRLPAPKDCPRAVHNLMLSCWKADRSERPKFEDIAQVLNGWIRSPETMKDGKNSVIGEWLHSIKMGNYTTLFLNAGYDSPQQLVGMQNEDLLKIGVRLIGHRNKILKTVKALVVTNGVDMTNTLIRTESIAV